METKIALDADSCLRRKELEFSALKVNMGSRDPQTQWEIPVVDLNGRREEVVEKMKLAASTVGFFQVVNHGVPESLMEAMLNMTREFHEMPEEEKLNYNSQNPLPGKNFFMNYAKSREGEKVSQLLFVIRSASIDPSLMPQVCRGPMMKYSQHMRRLGTILLEILSVALGLKTDHLLGMDCTGRQVIVLNYYGKTAKTEQTIGLSKHADRSFLTILVQDQIGGLQVLHQNQWLNVPPVSGALVVNIGDLLKLVSNNAFTSAEHRVLENCTKTRTSVAWFFSGDASSSKLYGPIKELLTENCPPLYHETTIKDFMVQSRLRGLDGNSHLAHLKL